MSTIMKDGAPVLTGSTMPASFRRLAAASSISPPPIFTSTGAGLQYFRIWRRFTSEFGGVSLPVLETEEDKPRNPVGRGVRRDAAGHAGVVRRVPELGAWRAEPRRVDLRTTSLAISK